MNSLSVAALVFAILFGGALLGVLLRRRLPEHHLSSEAKDTVKLAMGLVATMTALVLGLLVASAKGSYDTQRTEVIQMAAKIAFLDRVLTAYGAGADPARAALRLTVDDATVQLWPDDPTRSTRPKPDPTHGQALYGAIQQLPAKDDAQHVLKAQAGQLVLELGQMRWLLYAQSASSISRPLLVVVVAWLAFIFLSFGLFAPANPTVISALMVAALSVAGSIFLIMELDRPFGGFIQISSEPLRNVFSAANQ